MIGFEVFVGFISTTFVTAFTSFLLYWYSTRNFDFWKKRGVVYAKPIPFFGNTLELLWKPLNEIELERYFRLGRIYGHFEGNRPVLSVADPKVLREILVKEFPSISSRRFQFGSVGNPLAQSMLLSLGGEDWKRVRSIVSPTFSTAKMKRMISIIKDCAEVVVNNFTTVSAEGKPFDIKRMYGAFTMDAIASSAFSTKLDSLNDPESHFVKAAKKAFSTDFSWRVAAFQLFPNLMKFLKITIFPPEPLEFFKTVTLRIIEERRRTGQTRNDFLQLLIDTSKETMQDQKIEEAKNDEQIMSNYNIDDNTYLPIRNAAHKNLSEIEMVGQCVIFFIAGYDTTANTLACASYLLALYPEIQEKLFAELKEVVKKTGSEFTYEAMQEMKYFDNVIAETLRLYPVTPRLERVADVDLKLKEADITIPRDMIVTIPIYPLQRDPEIYPNPDVFDPDRFTAEERAKRDPYTYLPFGAGPRNCLGMRFALMEVKVCLAYVVANFKLLKCPRTKIPLDIHLGPGRLLVKEILLEVEPREEKILLR